MMGQSCPMYAFRARYVTSPYSLRQLKTGFNKIILDNKNLICRKSRAQTLCINGCQLKILLYQPNQPRLRIKILLNYQLKNEVSWTNFNTYKRIFNWQPFMHRVYTVQFCCKMAEISFLIIFDQNSVVCMPSLFG